MPGTLNEILNKMSEDRRALVHKRAQEIGEEINLSDLRRLRKLTQARLSKKLKIGQEGVSRIEKRTGLVSFNPQRIRRSRGRQTIAHCRVSRPICSDAGRIWRKLERGEQHKSDREDAQGAV